MKYYIKTTKGHYVRILADNSFCLTADINKAYLFDDKNKAENVLKNNIPRIFKKQKHGSYLVYAFNDENEELESQDSSDKEFNSDRIINKMSSEIQSLIDINKSDAIMNLSKIDQELSDMLHYIEFHKFSACDGYKLCKKLQQILDRRRVIKNELRVIQETQKLATPLRIMDKIEHQEYHPRVLNTLFETNKKRIRSEK